MQIAQLPQEMLPRRRDSQKQEFEESDMPEDAPKRNEAGSEDAESASVKGSNERGDPTHRRAEQALPLDTGQRLPWPILRSQSR